MDGTFDKLPLSRAERHPEKAHRPDNPIRRKPDWIRVRAPNSPEYAETKRLMREFGLTTVCEEAACPNIGECWKQKHATFMIMGDTCTRACAFCNVATGKPGALNPHEPANIAEAVGKLGLGHVVVTSVDRDDLPDGGAGHFAAVITAFLVTQLAGLVRRAGGLLAWAGLIEDSSYAERLDESLRGFYRHRWHRFLLSVAFHFCGWLLGALEVAAMLFVLDIPAGVATATVIEAVGSGVRFATFLVPGSLGVLEGANTGLFVALGLGASAGLAFSLVRRARQVVWIGIGLLVLVAASLQAKTAAAAPRRAVQ